MVSIFWGNQSSSPVSKQNYHESFEKYSKTFGEVFVLRQEHGVEGVVLNQGIKQNWSSNVATGDYLITNFKNTWIGVTTADCLPIIFYDPIKQVVAVAHAGWRGTVSKIVDKVLLEMDLNFDSEPKNLKIFFGPAAKPCCYEIDQKFMDNLADDKIAQDCFTERGKDNFFDVSRYNVICLLKRGVSRNNINLDYNVCTICSVGYCSYRRHGNQTMLQLSAVALR